MPSNLVERAHRLTESKGFQRFIVAVILVNAAVIGMETYPHMEQQWGALLTAVDRTCLGIFSVEILLKMLAQAPRPWRFFHSGWNVFDFLVVAAAFIPALQGQSTLLRMIRLLRVLRLLSSLPSLQVLVLALLHSVPRIGQMALLASLLFYVYAIIGQTLFGQHDPEHWATLHIALLSLFRILTLEDWTDLMYTAMELYPGAWVYFVSFVLLATFVIFNMLIGIILNSMEDARAQVAAEHRDDQPVPDAFYELEAARAALDRLEKRLTEHGGYEPGKADDGSR